MFVMKCIHVVLLLSIGLQSFKAQDEVTIVNDNTEATIIDEKDSTDSGKNYDEEPNELEARLPSDSQSIRSNIIDTKFNCKNHEPGYYADVENECQIFHRCLEGQERVFSFICPEHTMFSQRALVCVWNDTRDLDCADSESYYDESNRAFSGNLTAESNITENLRNSTEITDADEVEDAELADETRTNVMSEPIKHFEIPAHHELEVVHEDMEVIEKNSIEEVHEEVTEESNEFQVELIPHSHHGIDASIVASAASESEGDNVSHPQKITLSVDEPIVEMPEQLQIADTSRNFRKRSGRFLFKADAH